MKQFKRVMLALIIAITGVSAANAQFHFGVKAGVNVNHISNNLKQTFDSNNHAGWTAGVMAEFQVPVIGLCVDLSVMYARLNSTDSENRNFLQIPLNLKYKFQLPIVSRFVAPYIFTGPSFDFKLDKNTIENVSNFKTFQPVWNIGLGVELIRHLQVGASYGFGMNNILDKVASLDNTIKIHNNYWTITAAYLF